MTKLTNKTNAYGLARSSKNMKVVVKEADGKTSMEELLEQIENSAAKKRRNSSFYEMTSSILSRSYGLSS